MNGFDNFTPRAKQVITLANREAHRFNHGFVGTEHLLLGLVALGEGVAVEVLESMDVSLEAVRLEVEKLVGHGDGQTATAGLLPFTPRSKKIFQLAEAEARSMSHTYVGTEHLLLAMLREGEGVAAKVLMTLGIDLEECVKAVRHELESAENESNDSPPSGNAPPSGGGPDDEAEQLFPDPAEPRARSTTKGRTKTPALNAFGRDLTELARKGELDPVIGRKHELERVIQILCRRNKNNAALLGEAGVGKTAVVEGFAQRIVQGDVPGPLKNVVVRTLDLGLLQAGAGIKGEFENRLKQVIEEVKSSPIPIIIFIDEAHTMIGAGGSAGQNDAANLLKPALARGELRTIAATTWAEYKKYFEKDAALARRFQVVKVEEPSEPLAAAMLRGMAPLMERHFGVRVLDEAITEAVRLSHRYISGRQLPDKAVSVLDTACAKVALGQSATPGAIEDDQKTLERLQGEINALEREQSAGAAHDARLEALQAKRVELEQRVAQNTERLAQERALVARIQALREAREGGAAQAGEEDALPVAANSDVVSMPKRTRTTDGPDELAALLAELRALQGDTPMVPLQVDGHVVSEIVSAWTGIPLGRMVKDELRTVLNLKPLLAARVIGQNHALDAIAQRVRTATANLEDPNKPRGVFLFAGPSGVGKTETALALADILYGGERKLVTINMSEYQEAHSVSGLKGSPPGYVGYGEGGVLTEAVRRNPYSVVLLDEVEKAHPDVLEMFFQVFDKGEMDDAEGRPIDFRNTIIILTSNVGSSAIMQACINKPAEELPDADSLAEMLRPVLYKTFKPAFLGRTKVVPYYPIPDDVLAEIITLKLGRIRDRVAANHKATFQWDTALVESVLARCTEVDAGARAVDHILNGTLLPEIAESVLTRMAEGGSVEKIKVGVGKSGEFKYRIN